MSSSSELEPAARTYAPVKAARGLELSCKGWTQEAALRMLMNSLDEEVAERPRELVVCGGTGCATRGITRDWESLKAIVRSLRALENDETLLVHCSEPVGVFRTYENAPRVLLCNSASWMYIGSQEIVQETFETFAAAGDRHFNGDLGGRLIVSGGMGRSGGAQPMAATMTGAAFLGIEVDPDRIKRRLKNGDCDFMVNSLDEALRILKNALRKKENVSVGLVGNCADVIPELASRGVVPDLLTDQTPAHDPLDGYVPNGMTFAEALQLRARDPQAYEKHSLESMAHHAEGMLRLQKMGSVTIDYGNNLPSRAFQQGVQNAYDIPGFVPEYLRPLSCEGRGPFRWVALSGAARDIAVADELVLELFPENHRLRRWIELARKRIRIQGLPARIGWLDSGERVEFGLAINRLVKQGKIKAPVVMAREHADCPPVALPLPENGRRTEGSAAVGDWSLLNALLDTASGASWVSIHNGGIGYSQHSGQVTVADGTCEMARRIERVLTNNSGMGK